MAKLDFLPLINNGLLQRNSQTILFTCLFRPQKFGWNYYVYESWKLWIVLKHKHQKIIQYVQILKTISHSCHTNNYYAISIVPVLKFLLRDFFFSHIDRRFFFFRQLCVTSSARTNIVLWMLVILCTLQTFYPKCFLFVLTVTNKQIVL